MNELIALALRRAGVNTLAEFQALQGLPQTGEADPETQLALEPYLLGFRTIRIQPGDTYWELAARYGTTSQAIATANPSLDPERLPVGAPMRVPLGFPVVPTDVPMTSNLCSLCIRGLVGRYPGLCRMEALTTTAFGRPVEALTMGSGQRRVLYTAAHHANEWITATLLLAFAVLYPEVQVLLFFVIPIRVKYFGFFAAALWVLSFLGAPLPQKLSLLLSMANVWLFFGPMAYRSVRAWVRREQWKRRNRR